MTIYFFIQLQKTPYFANGFLFFSIINYFFNLYLKKWFHVSRPLHSLKKTFAMPSGTIQQLFFMIFFTSSSITFTKHFIFFFSLMIVIIACLKIKENEHTFQQMFVGGFIGMLFGLFTFWTMCFKAEIKTCELLEPELAQRRFLLQQEYKHESEIKWRVTTGT